MLDRTFPAPTAVIFDLDGTLIDSREDIAAALNHALEATGRPTLSSSEISTFVGDGARALVARATSLEESSAEVSVVLEAFSARYRERPVHHTRWRSGAPNVLGEVEALGLRSGLCTNKSRAVTDLVLAALGVEGRFGAVYGGGDGPEKKPDAGPLLRLAATLGVHPSSLVMVGDGLQDIGAARAVGCRAVAVAGGHTSREALVEAAPDLLVDELDELGSALAGWARGSQA